MEVSVGTAVRALEQLEEPGLDVVPPGQVAQV